MSTNPFQKPASNDSFAINLEGVQDGYHIEPGQYPAILADIEQAKSKTSGNPMWVFTFSIVEGEYAGTTLSDWKMYCSLKQNALFKLKRVLKALGFDTGASAEFKVQFDKEDALGRRVLMDIEDRQNQDGELGSQISNVFPHPDGPFDDFVEGDSNEYEENSDDGSSDDSGVASSDDEGATADESEHTETHDEASDNAEDESEDEEYTGDEEETEEESAPTPEPPKPAPAKPRNKPTLK